MAILLLAAPGIASAHPRVVKTKLTLTVFGFIQPSGSYAYAYGASVGGLGTPSACATHREVQFFRDERQGRDTQIGSHRSNFEGIAVVLKHNPPLASVAGHYYAKVGPARGKRHGHRPLKCLGDRSNTVKVSAPSFHAARSGFALQTATNRLRHR